MAGGRADADRTGLPRGPTAALGARGVHSVPRPLHINAFRERTHAAGSTRWSWSKSPRARTRGERSGAGLGLQRPFEHPWLLPVFHSPPNPECPPRRRCCSCACPAFAPGPLPARGRMRGANPHPTRLLATGMTPFVGAGSPGGFLEERRVLRTEMTWPRSHFTQEGRGRGTPAFGPQI